MWSLPSLSHPKWSQQGAIIKGSRPSSREENSPILIHAQEEPLPLVIVGCLGLLWLWVFCRYVLQKMILWSTILMYALFLSIFYSPLTSKYCIVKGFTFFRSLNYVYDSSFIWEIERWRHFKDYIYIQLNLVNHQHLFLHVEKQNRHLLDTKLLFYIVL